MYDTERVEASFRRSGKVPVRNITGGKPRAYKSNGPVTMDMGNVTLKKLFPAECDMCRKKGCCFRCRENGKMANKCPKSRVN